MVELLTKFCGPKIIWLEDKDFEHIVYFSDHQFRTRKCCSSGKFHFLADALVGISLNVFLGISWICGT
jgi:hypothetical protein